jgi:hypothetical protein
MALKSGRGFWSGSDNEVTTVTSTYHPLAPQTEVKYIQAQHINNKHIISVLHK